MYTIFYSKRNDEYIDFTKVVCVCFNFFFLSLMAFFVIKKIFFNFAEGVFYSSKLDVVGISRSQEFLVFYKIIGDKIMENQELFNFLIKLYFCCYPDGHLTFSPYINFYTWYNFLNILYIGNVKYIDFIFSINVHKKCR